jgi:PAS domain S-box-containing protein
MSAFGLVINALLPYGLSFVELPPLRWIDLPWGEQVLDLRVYRRSAWHNVGWIGIFVISGYAIYACLCQYRRGARQRALLLALGLCILIGFVLFNQAVNRGWIDFVQTGDFGLVGLVLIMSYGLARELRQSDARVRAILDNVPSSVSIKDREGRYLFVNRGYEERHGVSSEAVLGKTDRQLFAARQAEALSTHDREVVAAEGPHQYEEVVEVGDKTKTFTSLKFPLRDLDGGVYAVCGVSADLTDLRKAQLETRALRQHLWHADRVARTGQISASLAHELNQPLAAILSNAQAALRFLARDDADLGEIREILGDIVRDDKRASGVIASLRALVSRQETERAAVDVAQAVHELIALVRSELVERRIQLHTALAADCTIRGNKNQIQQVMLNLVMNAVDAMADQPEGSRQLTVSAECTQRGQILVGVHDTGRGIGKENLHKVFDSFWTTKQHGMGMGLVVCRSIVESHEGSIWIEPNAPTGVTAYFTLPAHGPALPIAETAL